MLGGWIQAPWNSGNQDAETCRQLSMTASLGVLMAGVVADAVIAAATTATTAATTVAVVDGIATTDAGAHE